MTTGIIFATATRKNCWAYTATQFQATDDSFESARQSLDAYCIPRGSYTFAFDFMVFNVTKEAITQRRLDVSRHEYPYGYSIQGTPEDPKYHKHALDPFGNSIVVGDPKARLLLDDQIADGPDTYDKAGYQPGSSVEVCELMVKVVAPAAKT